MKFIQVLFVLIALFYAPFSVAEPTPDQCQNFVWDAVTTDTIGNDISADITGYSIYFGTSPGVYGVPADVGNVLTVPIDTVLPAVDGMYYATLTAKTATTESAYANEIELAYASGAFRLGGVPVSPAPFRVQCSVVTP
ncbi:MAG: hypothetical protein KZQ93_15845 [Candidatus Thiodiazotropha sp. (ex Monitilora ramsayi)]|nr:hypothetical protein [Candidatus Thiodiazotropha sp. (ex Monitilora ramsayi)]